MITYIQLMSQEGELWHVQKSIELYKTGRDELWCNKPMETYKMEQATFLLTQIGHVPVCQTCISRFEKQYPRSALYKGKFVNE